MTQGMRKSPISPAATREDLIAMIHNRDALIFDLKPAKEREEIAWLLLSRWENIARNSGEDWLRYLPLAEETTKLLNDEALAKSTDNGSAVSSQDRKVTT